jgi:hypothetical protein
LKILINIFERLIKPTRILDQLRDWVEERGGKPVKKYKSVYIIYGTSVGGD